MLPPFVAPRLKIERANRHIEELGQAIKKYLDGQPLEIIVEDWSGWHARGEMHAWTAHILKLVPAELSSIIGDIVHNLRTSLDILACDLVRLNGGKIDGVYFPFCKRPDELPDMIRRRNMHRAAPKTVELLRKLSLYPGVNSPLRAIHDLNVMDKHQALIPSISAVSIPAFTYRFGGKDNIIPEWQSAVVRDGQAVMIMPAAANVPLGSRIDAVAGLIFEQIFKERSIIDGQEVLPALMHLAEDVKRTLEAFVCLYPDGTSMLPIREAPPNVTARTLLIGETNKGS